MGPDIETIVCLPDRPDPWEPGTHSIWTDERLAMLDAHLDGTTDAASRSVGTIEATVDWLDGLLGGTGRILDLGCGPGLYTQRLAGRGHDVVGVDLSERSVAHARLEAERDGLAVEYLVADYTQLDLQRRFDLIILVYFDLGTLDPAATERLLDRVHDWLADGGRFVFDVLTPASLPEEESRDWGAEPAGFWAPVPHLWLERTQLHGPGHLIMDETTVFTGDGPPRVYRVWERRYDPDEIEALLAPAGLRVESLVGDLTGTVHELGSETLGVIATREDRGGWNLSAD